MGSVCSPELLIRYYVLSVCPLLALYMDPKCLCEDKLRIGKHLATGVIHSRQGLSESLLVHASISHSPLLLALTSVPFMHLMTHVET